MHRLIFRSLLTFVFFCTAFVSSAQLNIVASIKPLYGLVINVSGDKNKVELLVNSTASPHHYQLKPSDVKKLLDADIIFYIDDKFEIFLSNYLSDHNVKAKVVRLSESKGLKFLKVRSKQDLLDGTRKKHCGCKHGDKDIHFWGDLDNAQHMVKKIEEILIASDPKNKHYYEHRASQTQKRLINLDQELIKKLEPIRMKNFIVFHDGYQYFEKRYNLSNVGAIAIGGNKSYGAKTIAKIKDLVKEKGVKCIFAEPQFSSDIVNKIAENSGIKSNYLDIEWGVSYSGLKPEDYYFMMMRHNADMLVECLS